MGRGFCELRTAEQVRDFMEDWAGSPLCAKQPHVGAIADFALAKKSPALKGGAQLNGAVYLPAQSVLSGCHFAQVIPSSNSGTRILAPLALPVKA